MIIEPLIGAARGALPTCNKTIPCVESGVVAAGHNWYLLTTLQCHGSCSHSVCGRPDKGEFGLYLKGSNELIVHLIQYKLEVVTMVHQL